MKTNLTIDQIEVREKVWNASQRFKNDPELYKDKDMGLLLSVGEVKELWDSIINTGRELSELRDRAEKARKLLTPVVK